MSAVDSSDCHFSRSHNTSVVFWSENLIEMPQQHCPVREATHACLGSIGLMDQTIMQALNA